MNDKDGSYDASLSAVIAHSDLMLENRFFSLNVSRSGSGHTFATLEYRNRFKGIAMDVNPEVKVETVTPSLLQLGDQSVGKQQARRTDARRRTS
jgi:hypothetical protein